MRRAHGEQLELEALIRAQELERRRELLRELGEGTPGNVELLEDHLPEELPIASSEEHRAGL